MNDICLICADKRFARMLELEFSGIGLHIKSVTEKLNPPALKMTADSSSLVVFDADYYSGDIAFVKKTELPFVVFGKNTVPNLPENVIAFFERPFAIAEFTELIGSKFNIRSAVGAKNVPAKGVGNMELDQFSKQVTIGGAVIKFSPKEFALLSLLYKNRGRIVSRKDVISTVWGEDYDTKNNVDNVYINYLRKKLDDNLGVKMIYTVRGKGYMMK